MRISDWSSDVCSADLVAARDIGYRGLREPGPLRLRWWQVSGRHTSHRPGRKRGALLRRHDGAHAGKSREGLRPARRCEPCTRSEEHTSELQSLMRISYAVFCLKKKNKDTHKHNE